MDKGKGIAKDNVPNDSINGMDDNYDDMFDDGANPDVRPYAMGSNFEEDEEDMEGVVDAVAGMKSPADAVEGAYMDALKSSNETKGINMGAKQNKKLKMKKSRIVVQYNVLGVPTGDEATKLILSWSFSLYFDFNFIY